MNPTLKQTKEDDQTAKENKLRKALRDSEEAMIKLKKEQEEILMNLGLCMVERMDEEA